MKIYTNHNGKHLFMPVPRDWTIEDVKFFITGKIREDLPLFNPKPHLELVEAEIIEVDANELEPEEEPKVFDGKCAKHPNYTGRRLGKNARECPGCLSVYKAAHPADKDA